MAVASTRLFVFTLFPLLLAWIVVRFDSTSSSRMRRLEVLMIFLFALMVGGGGIANFFAHFFLSDRVATFIGWEAGSPFQLEVAFANLAMGVLGIVAVGRRDGFREATVLAVTIFSVGATIVHLMDIAVTGNLAPGNSVQNVINLARPVLLIWALRASRSAEADPKTVNENAALVRWRAPLRHVSGQLTITIATAYGIGFAIDLPWLLTIVGAVSGIGLVLAALHRSPLHDVTLRKSKSSRSA